ncbi:hypothetical protein [Campylobacter troglodytis]|nr:hypothetical protein [Campylobacter troglodytis]
MQLLAKGAKRVRGKRGRGAGKKTPMFLLRYPSCPFARRKAKTLS